MIRGGGAQTHGFGAGSPAAQAGCAPSVPDSLSVAPANGVAPQGQLVACAGVATKSAIPARQSTAPNDASRFSSFIEFPFSDAALLVQASA